MSTTVRHDPFARGGYERVSCGSGTCLWCGQVRQRLYSYEWEDDDASHRRRIGMRPHQAIQVFCNFECFDSYHS